MLSILIGIEHAINGHKQLSKTWHFFYPKKKNMYKHWTNLFVRYNIELWLDTTFYLPLRNSTNTDYFSPIEGFSNLEKAIKKKKGVLVPTIHLGEFYHTLFSLFYKEIVIDGENQKILLAILGSKENDFLFREQLKPIKNLKVIITNDFNNLKKTVASYLRKNYTVFFLNDFYSENQLRCPFIHNLSSFDFLIPCPQMINHFHLNLGSPIIPAIAIPTSNLKHSFVKFFPEISIEKMEISNENELIRREILKFRKGILNKKQKYGLLSLLVNRQLYPYILKYPFLWQGAFLFFNRTKFRIHLTDINSYADLLSEILIKLELFINKTYEPEREDEKILEQIHEIFSEIEEMGNDPKDVLEIRNKSIELGRLNGKNAFLKAISLLFHFQTEYTKKKYHLITEKLNSLMVYFKD
ncbi:MAG: hypothetical protein ACTSXK_01160 [Promethearchaeota archaeon]